jgi:moderate conductance mechanosensitive channel
MRFLASTHAAESPNEPQLWTGEWFVDWFVGTPVRVVVIIIAALVARRVLHRIINGVVTRAGAVAAPKRMFGGKAAPKVIIGSTTMFSERRAQRAKTLGSLMRSVATAVIYSIATVMVLQELGFDVAPLIASAGIVGVALGFGAQNLVKDFLNGVFMLAEDQYGVGDVVDMGQARGTVEAVGLRITRLRDDAGAAWFVRNGEVLRLGNKSQGWSTAIVDVTVGADEDLDKVRELLTQLATQLVEDPAFVDVVDGDAQVLGFETVTPDAVTFRVVIRTKPLESDGVERELRHQVQQRFASEGVRLATHPMFAAPPPPTSSSTKITGEPPGP